MEKNKNTKIDVPKEVWEYIRNECQKVGATCNYPPVTQQSEVISENFKSSMSSDGGKKSLHTQKSEPVSTKGTDRPELRRKTSAPAVFVFPDGNRQQSVNTSSCGTITLSADGIFDSFTSQASGGDLGMCFRSNGDGEEDVMYERPLSRIGLTGTPGVSVEHFQALVEEMVRTKQALQQALQTKQVPVGSHSLV